MRSDYAVRRKLRAVRRTPYAVRRTPYAVRRTPVFPSFTVSEDYYCVPYRIVPYVRVQV